MYLFVVVCTSLSSVLICCGLEKSAKCTYLLLFGQVCRVYLFVVTLTSLPSVLICCCLDKSV